MAATGSASDGSTKSRRRVGLVYDERMCRHRTPDDEHHPENPNRIRAIWNKLHSAGIAQRCQLVCLPTLARWLFLALSLCVQFCTLPLFCSATLADHSEAILNRFIFAIFFYPLR